MKKNFVLLILSAVLLTKSLGKTEDIFTSNELTPNAKAFRDLIIAKLAALSEDPLKLAKQLFKNTYANKSNNDTVANDLAEVLAGFDELNNPIDKIEVFLFTICMFDILREPINYGVEKINSVLSEREAPKKHDVKAVAYEHYQKFDEFLEWLTQEFEAQRYKFTSEEQLRVKAFRDLCLQFIEETNFKKKQRAMDDLTKRLEYIRSYNSIINEE